MIKTSKFQGKKILVLGLAKSGTAAAELLLDLGAEVTVNDREPYEKNKEAQQLKEKGANVVCGSHPVELVHNELDYVVKNPGIRYDNPLVSAAEQKGIPVITEMELAYKVSEAEIIGITGSNGKTTTTTYLFEMLRGGEREPLVAGNIGEVACEVAQRATSENIMVTELSSFQLLGTREFRPKISILLNIVEAHLDYHGSMSEYIEAKAKVFANQKENDFFIYNADDETVSRLAQRTPARKVPFSTKTVIEEGACIRDGWLEVFGEKLIKADEMSLPGEHNIANGLAAAAAAYLSGALKDRIKDVLRTFTGVEHRLQFVTEYGGRSFYNNSKATNVPAAITSLKAFEGKPVVLIAGGLDRGVPFTGLVPYLRENVKAVITYGETAAKIAEAAAEAGVPAVVKTSVLSEAVPAAYAHSSSGDVILLSPACASWDQFRTFEERGEHFVNAVKNLIQ
ncbi:UDP-N-acetylmuramoyl-L-alanine--D-glutamate ligase [Evansella clarkii]|uniref:UDP-N-acetylmuramoyl-L-alanine--D-glutamate ligase n=1 Tax=Evansella clarkii TaxID=79879 RepID=UPI000B450D6D|nr:UDP-N-acetylmuramoyl-L-alanine--D-glutamate ligase [Evansella clarkii]